jgi:hypothetical protein
MIENIKKRSNDLYRAGVLHLNEKRIALLHIHTKRDEQNLLLSDPQV